ncbi:PqqD family protein [Leucobacter exalbidus]|nr:PqqD family protein [Leucobacter exalbidus]
MWRRAEVASVESLERAAVMPLSGDLSHPPLVLERQAAAVWHVLRTEPRAEADIVADVAQLYGVDSALIAEDVRAFLAELAQQGLALVE